MPETVPIGTIAPARWNPRTRRDPAALEALEESIRTHGILQPLLVRKLGAPNGGEADGARRGHPALRRGGGRRPHGGPGRSLRARRRRRGRGRDGREPARRDDAAARRGEGLPAPPRRRALHGGHRAAPGRAALPAPAPAAAPGPRREGGRGARPRPDHAGARGPVDPGAEGAAARRADGLLLPAVGARRGRGAGTGVRPAALDLRQGEPRPRRHDRGGLLPGARRGQRRSATRSSRSRPCSG